MVSYSIKLVRFNIRELRDAVDLPLRIPFYPQSIEGVLHLLMEVAKVHLGGVWWNPNGRRLQHKRWSERQRNLEFIPALELDFVFHRNVKAKNRRARIQCEQDWALFCEVFWPAGTVNRKSAIAASPDFARHLG